MQKAKNQLAASNAICQEKGDSEQGILAEEENPDTRVMHSSTHSFLYYQSFGLHYASCNLLGFDSTAVCRSKTLQLHRDEDFPHKFPQIHLYSHVDIRSETETLLLWELASSGDLMA